ncbi:MAG: histidine kinase [Proteobacteria bacterium]|nr:histidine kinase [Pseudomonadota bacterium]
MHSLRSSIITGSNFNKFFATLFWLLMCAGLYLSKLYSFVLFHSMVEIFSVIIAFGVFMVAWNSRRLITNNFILFIGIAYFFVGWIDLIHTFAYKGINIFKEFDTDLASQLWIAGRFMESISLLIAPLFLQKRLKPRIVFAGYLFITICLLASIFYFRVFPDCFIEGRGLTRFKIFSEYIISSILAASIVLLFRHRDKFDKSVLSLIACSILFTIGSELCFTLYMDVYGLSNFVGHFFKVVSFYFMYRAMIEIGLEKPYSFLLRDFKVSEAALKHHQEELEELVKERTNELRATNEQLIEVSKRLGEAEDNERRRISRELHDTVGQNLTALGITLNILRSKLLQEASDAVCLRIDDALAMVEETTENIRSVISQLRPPVLDDYGLFAALRSFGEHFSLRTSINVVLEGEETFPKLNMYIEGALFRITQEALNNAAKHARASKIIVSLKNHVDHVTLTIKDDGVGFDPNNITNIKRLDKWGLTNIKERAMSVGGRCHIESSPGKGAQITVEVAL